MSKNERQVSGFESPEALYGLCGQDLDEYLAMSTENDNSEKPNKIPEVKPESNGADAGIGSTAISGATQMHDNPGFYSQYEL